MGTALNRETLQCSFARANALRQGLFAGAALLAVIAGVGCTSIESSGGRPLVYKVAPGDPPSSIHTAGGVIYKQRSGDQAVAPAESPRPAQGAAQASTQVARADAPPTPAPVAPPAPAAPPAAAAAPSAPAAAPAAAALGPSALDARYTQASRYGDLLFLSGQIAIDLASGELIADRSIEAQTRQVMENLRHILEAHGLTMANLLSTQVFLRSINNFIPMDAVYRQFFKGAPPARTVVEVSNLPRGMEVEISAVAGK
jgi:2-iminobutanoate/2-iminopropanoate deaminase